MAPGGDDAGERAATGVEVAVVGMAGRFAAANDVASFWELVRDGRDGLTRFDDDTLRAAGIDEATFRAPSYVRVKGLLASADHFAAAHFGYSAREAEIMDPQIRLLHECAHEALDDAGCDPTRERGPIGVYAGAMPNYAWEARVGGRTEDFADVFDAMHLLDKDFASSRISHRLDLRGPSVTVMTACSTGLASVHLACRALLTGECRVALAGAASVYLPLRAGYTFREGGVASPDGTCRPFDARANGTVPGDGAGVVVLKLLEDALADGDHVYAVVKGSAMNNDGGRKLGYVAGSVDGLAEVIRAAHRFAQVSPASIGHVEAHALGTRMGDALELEAMRLAFEGSTRPCGVGSVKPNIGYLGPAAGIASFIKATLALHHRVLPPTLHFAEPNPLVRFEATPFRVNVAPIPWDEEGPRRAGVTSVGVGGTNVHVVLEEAPPRSPPPAARGWSLLTISGRTEAARDEATDALAMHLRAHPQADLRDAAYTLQTGRRAYELRRTVACREPGDAAEALAALDPRRTRTGAVADAPVRVVLLFPDHAVGRGVPPVDPLLGHDSLCRDDLAALLRTAAQVAGHDVAASPRLENSALRSLGVQVALARALARTAGAPDAVGGRGLGELAGACVAGALSAEDALRLVVAVDEAAALAPGRGALCVYAGEEVASALAGPRVRLASVAPNRCVLVGARADLDEVAAAAAARQVETRALPERWEHRAVLPPGAPPAKLAGAVEALRLSPPGTAYASSVLGELASPEAVASPAHWMSWLEGRRRPDAALDALLAWEGPVSFVEVGPERELSRAVQRNAGRRPGHVALAAAADAGDGAPPAWLNVLGALWSRGREVRWEHVHAGARRRRIPLPAYPLERTRFPT